MVGQTASANERTLPATRRNYLDRWLVLGMLGVLMFLNIALISWKVSIIPVRGVLAVGLLFVLSVLYPDAAARGVARHRPILLLAAALATLGTFVSVVNGAGLEAIIQAVVEVHIQIAVTLLVATIVAEVAGARSSIYVIIAVIGLSAVVAILQFADVDGAWRLREMLGNLQGQKLNEFGPFINKRPMGLTYSPIQLATQFCLAFGAYAVLRNGEGILTGGRNRTDPAIIVAALFLIALSVVTGTRSPILGAAILLALYSARRQGVGLALMLLGGGAIAYFAGTQIIEALQSSQPRVVRVNDDSAIGRLSLIKFGLLLFGDNPLGYGFTFTPSEHWMKFWRELYDLQGSDDIQSKELHNYILNMLNTYGIGIILVLPLAIGLLRRSSAHLLFFVPYIVHIMFHNSGPFWNDTIIWFVIGALGVLTAQPRVLPGEKHAVLKP